MGLGKSGTGTGIFRVKRERGPGLSLKYGQGPGCGAVTATGNHRVYVLDNACTCTRLLITAAEASTCSYLNWPWRELG